MSTWVAVPCPGSRLDELRVLLDGLEWPRSHVLVLTTEPDPIDPRAIFHEAGHVIVLGDPEVNIARWWNLMFDRIERENSDPSHEVLCLTSDSTGSRDGVLDLSLCREESGAAMIGPDWLGRLDDLELRVLNDQPRTVYDRVPPTCFMVDGTLGLRCDERHRWWYCEDDLEMRARQRGPVALAGGIDLHPSGRPATELDPERQGWARDSRALFVDTWKVEPW